ncbi:cytochrome c-type biogenesis protein CcmH [Pelagibacterales bacterium SAG-MED13]|nr:cytochrome c-type biogenesis protein CcmH [Pelagibacterales bacterium SAG-MED13]
MKFLNFFIILILTLNLNISKAKADVYSIENKITKNIRCLICQGQSIYDSDSEFAISLKLVVQNKIKQGFTEKQIYDFLSNKYGEWILYDPSFNKNTYFLWLLPLLIFLIGGAIIINKLKIKK